MIALFAIAVVLAVVHGQMSQQPDDVMSHGVGGVGQHTTYGREHRVSRALSHQLIIVTLQDKVLYPRELVVKEQSCFGAQHVRLQPEDKLVVKANGPFLVFFKTRPDYNYYSLQKKTSQQLRNIKLNYMYQSVLVDALQIITIPLNMSCNILQGELPYLKMKGTAVIQFQDNSGLSSQKIIEFNFLIICAKDQQIQKFNNVYKYGYIAFWIYLNLFLQIYHGYARDSSHAVLFLVYLSCSLLIGNRMVGYVVSSMIFVVVVLRERKQNKINNKVFSLYMAFLMLILMLVLYSYQSEIYGNDWNLMSISLDNFVQIHITMFLILRLIKLPRFRYVFWYFIAVAVLSVLLAETNNRYFQLAFENIYDLTCIKTGLFFPLMMLPISNYLTSMTRWMHRLMGLGIVGCSLLPLGWAIKAMGLLIVVIMISEVRKHSVDAIKHRY